MDVVEAEVPEAGVQEAEVPEAEVPEAEVQEAEVQEAEVPEAEVQEALARDVEEWEEEELVPFVAPNLPSKPRSYLGDVLLDVDTRFAPMIIGHGAATIQGLRRDTGAFISIIDSTQPGKKTVKIWGSKRAKILAKRLIKKLIHDSKKKEDQEHSEEEAMKDLNNTPTVNTKNLKMPYEEHYKKRLALPRTVKSFYKEHPEVTALSDQQVADFRLSMNIIRVECTNKRNISIPKPVLKFSHAFENYPEIINKIQKQKFDIPSPVQCQAWPIIMGGHDLIVVSRTDTGKILTYLLPAFIHINLQPTPRELRKGPTVLALAPTRELVVQINNEAKKYAPKGIKSMSLYCSHSSKEQKKSLLEGVEILISTPGRLYEFINRGLIDLSDVSYLILDEADRMLDLGTELYLRSSLFMTRSNKQTIMMSATWSSEVEQFAKKITINSVQIMIGSLDLTTVNAVKQEIFLMEEEEKQLWLYNFLKNITEEDKVIIIVRRKWDVVNLATHLLLEKFTVGSMYGGLEKSDHEMTLDNVHNASSYILLATEKMSCDIDIDNATIIINYDFPNKIENYIDRFGHIGRAEKTGLAITLMTKCDLKKSKFLVELIKKSGQKVPPELHDMAKRFETSPKPLKGKGFSRGNGNSSR